MPLSVHAVQGCVAVAPALRPPLRRLARSGRQLGSPKRRSQEKAVKMKTRESRAGQGRPILFQAVACKACSAHWMSDPALQVVCAECGAGPGEPCRWQRPHGYGFHIRRDQLAMREGHLSACDALTWDGRHSRQVIAISAPTQLALL